MQNHHLKIPRNLEMFKDDRSLDWLPFVSCYSDCFIGETDGADGRPAFRLATVGQASRLSIRASRLSIKASRPTVGSVPTSQCFFRRFPMKPDSYRIDELHCKFIELTRHNLSPCCYPFPQTFLLIRFSKFCMSSGMEEVKQGQSPLGAARTNRMLNGTPV